MSPTVSLLITIVTSAAVGSLVTAIVQAIGASWERRARRQELLLARALDLAQARTERMIGIANTTGRTATLRDDIYAAEGYFRWLSYLMDHGKLPTAAHDLEAESCLKLETPELPEVEGTGTKLPGGRPRRR